MPKSPEEKALKIQKKAQEDRAISCIGLIMFGSYSAGHAFGHSKAYSSIVRDYLAKEPYRVENTFHLNNMLRRAAAAGAIGGFVAGTTAAIIFSNIAKVLTMPHMPVTSTLPKPSEAAAKPKISP